MGKKVRKSLSDGENSLQGIEKTIVLDSTSDTDIIECSIESGNYKKFLKNEKNSVRRGGVQSPKPLPNKELQDICNIKTNIKNLDSNYALSLISVRRNSLRKSAKPADDEVSLHTPHPIKTGRESNSAVKKIISTLKKTPDAPYLSISKLRNIEQWLKENEVETVRTPPFANLSVTPMSVPKKPLSSKWENEKEEVEETSIDSDVEGVLKAVYGEDWQQKNIRSRAKTEPKKKRVFTPVSQVNKNNVVKHFRSVRRNILNAKKLNLDDASDEENFDNSIVSGVRLINLDSSICSDENIKLNLLKTLQSGRKYRENKIHKGGSVESLPSNVQEKKKLKGVPVGKVDDQVLSGKTPLKTPKKTFLASLSVSTPTSRCHPDAQYYKINFKSKKEELVKKLYKLYNSEVFDDKLAEDMNFSWNVKLRGTAGFCYNKRITKSTGEVIRVSRIEFSTKIVDRADRLRDTLIHELCHAASWVIDGVLDGHGDTWNKWASKAMERFSELPPIKRCHNYDIVSKYVYRCTGCGYSIKRHSKSINTERKRCGHCYGVLELLINKRKKGKQEVPEFDTTRTLPTPNKFAMFVKENYHSVKSTKTDAKHSEIMKILSEKYAFVKQGSKSVKKYQGE